MREELCLNRDFAEQRENIPAKNIWKNPQYPLKGFPQEDISQEPDRSREGYRYPTYEYLSNKPSDEIGIKKQILKNIYDVKKRFRDAGKKAIEEQQEGDTSDAQNTSTKPVYEPVNDADREATEEAQTMWEAFQAGREAYGEGSTQEDVNAAKNPNGHPQNDVRKELNLPPITQERLDKWRDERTKPRSKENPHGWVQWSEVKKEKTPVQEAIRQDVLSDSRSSQKRKDWVQTWT